MSLMLRLGPVLCAAAAVCGCGVFFAPFPGGQPGVLATPDGIDPANPAVERSTHFIDFNEVRTLRIDVPVGRVTVRHVADAAASLKVTETVLRPGLFAPALKEVLLASGVNVRRAFVDASRLEIDTFVAKGLHEREVSFELLLVVPRSVPMQIVVESGPVEVVDVTENVEIETNASAITLKNPAGSVVARTQGGDIHVENAGGSVELVTSEADITLTARTPQDARISAQTTNGSISVGVPMSTAAAVNLNAGGGSVSANLAGFQVTELATGGDFLRGVLNNGGGRIEAQTTMGRITFAGMP